MRVYWWQIPPMGVVEKLSTVDWVASAIVYSISSLVSEVPASSSKGICRSR